MGGRIRWLGRAAVAGAVWFLAAGEAAGGGAAAPGGPCAAGAPGYWSPYVVGAGIGVLSWLAFLLLDKPIGCSTAFARTAGMVEGLFRGGKVTAKAYYQQFAPVIDWEWMLVLGLLAGAVLSAVTFGQFELQWVPAAWSRQFGEGVPGRWLVSLAGGVAVGFGARWAGGCTSGHGISGSLQLAVSSWISAACFFVGGIATAMLLYG